MKKYFIVIILLILVFGISILLTKRGNDIGSNETITKSSNIEPHESSSSIINQKTKRQERSELGDSSKPDLKWVPDELISGLLAGGVEVPITFETEISPELRKAIIYDLNLIFGHLKSHRYLDSSGAPEVSIQGKLKHPDQFLTFEGQGRYFPNELVGKIGLMVKDQMVIPSSVIKLYEEAWDRKNSNEQIYDSLLLTIRRLNNLTDNPVDRPQDWFFLPENAQASGAEPPNLSSEQFSENFGGYRYRQPSLLEIFDGASWDPNLSGSLVAKVYVFDSKGEIKNSMPPLIFSNGSWQFFIGQPPT